MAVAVATGTARALRFTARRLRTASIARPRQRHVELALHRGMDEFANAIAQASFDRIKPVVEKMDSRVGLGLRLFKLHGNVRHGVVSSPTLQRRTIRG